MSEHDGPPGAGENYKEPLLAGAGASDYERYLRTDELLALQKTPADWAHRDELLFTAVHQTSELWLKFAAGEVDEAAALTGRAGSGKVACIVSGGNIDLSTLAGILTEAATDGE